MNLWEKEILPLRDKLDRLTAVARLRIAVEAIDWTVQTSTTSIEYQRAVEWIDAVLDEAGAAVARLAEHAEITEELVDQCDDVDEDAEETGVSQLLMGISNLWGSHAMTSEELEGTLYSCYVFSQQRQVPEPETLEDEEADPRCREVIDHQRDLIIQATAQPRL